MSGLLFDFRFGVRMLLKRRGTSVLAAVALALGIGLTTTMFSIVNGVILRGLPFEESNRLLHLGRENPARGNTDNFAVSPHDYVDWRARQTVFSDFAAFSQTQVIMSGGGLNADRYRGVHITASTLKLLRIAPVRGRAFNEQDEQVGAPPVVLISYRTWESEFRLAPSAIGTAVRVNGKPAEIIGVMPPKFGFPESQNLWLPLSIELPAKRGDGRSLEVVGRLKPGVSRSEATTAMKAVAAQLEAEHVENKGISAQLKPFLEEYIDRDVISTLFTMLGAVFGVLLIACANVTNLQLARALERAREIAIRSAIGAERWRIVRQLVVEGLLLAFAGAVAGVLIAYAGVTYFNAGIGDTNPPFWIDIRIDLKVLGFVMILTVASALLSTVLPALRVTRGGASDVLKEQGRGSTSLRAGLVSRVLVGFAVTLSCALLLVSGLMIKSVIEIGRVKYGFKADDVLMARTTLDETRFQGDSVLIDAADRLAQKLGAIGGVRRAAIGTNEPLNGGAFYLTKEGQVFPPPDSGPTVRRIAAMPAYFDVVGITATRGRLLLDSDKAGTTPVVLITQDVADRHFTNTDPIGQRVRLGRNPAWPWWTIVGVVPTLASSNGDAVTQTAFVPFEQAPSRELTMLLSAGENPLAAAPALREVVRSIDQDLPVFAIEPFGGMLHRRSWPFRLFGSLFMAFGLSALTMAAAGLYGVLAYGVRLRTQEIGVRMALGADRNHVVRMILRQGLIVVGIGLVIGLGIGFLLGPMMSELFFNVKPTDPLVFGLTTAVLLTTGVIASVVPALRAASVDPLEALRQA
ncbi:MAG TPA: ABC transporter permease [Vicinamibacterales bacterium]|nr:ABC transporter permease [Vicinamibacterales bacterium]